MLKTIVTISGKDEQTALTEGARQLGVDPEEVSVTGVDDSTYTVSLKSAPGQLEIVVREDDMAAVIKAILPPVGYGSPLDADDVAYALADRNIVFGIDEKAIEDIVSEVADTGTPRNNIVVATGEPPKHGEDGRIDFKVGQDAANGDPEACFSVKPGQVIAVWVPATKGTPGQNIRGREIPAKDGQGAEISPGENVTLAKDKNTFIATAYGTAQATPEGVSVKKLLRVSDDKMRAEMDLFPRLADNSELTFEDVVGILEKEGVLHGIKENVVREALEAGQRVPNLRVAEAIRARDGVDARVEFKFRLNDDEPEAVDAARRDGGLDASAVVKELVKAGDVLARRFPVEEAVDGCTVTGEILKGAEPRDKLVKAGKNVRILDDGVTYVVEDGVVGYADYVEGELCVEDAVRVSEDQLCAYLSVHPPSGSGKVLTADMVEKLLADRGIVHDIDRKAIEQAFTDASRGDKPLFDMLIAEGTAPEKGQDARFEFNFQPLKSPGTITDPSGRMNFRERGSIQNLKAGDVLAVKIPSTPGKEGINLFGGVIPVEPGADKELIPADNVAVSDDGLTYTAEIDGMVALIQENKIAVFKHHEIPGDVDYSTGDLKMDGSLSVKGWIRSGFQVRSSGEIFVGQGVEDAIVVAGANIQVYGGIIGSGKATIYAGGDLAAHFLEGARVHAGGNLFVRDDILRSAVSADGTINVTEGKGRILGGTVEAGRSIEANEIGAETGVNTHVAVGMDLNIRRQMAKAQKRLEDLKRNKAKINMVLSRYGKKKKDSAIHKEEARKLGKAVKLKREIELKEIALTNYRKKLAGKMSETDVESAAVRAKKAVYQGTTVVIRGCAYHVREDIMGKVTFVFNQEQQAVEPKT